MPVPNLPAATLHDGWNKRPFFESWTRGVTSKWNTQWTVYLHGKQYVAQNGLNRCDIDLTFPTPLAAMMWVELEIANAS